MNDLVIENNKIEDMIYEIRGVQVMLDFDLARIYECANGTKSINLAVKRHINRFPERFMFQLTEDECKEFLRFQIETLNNNGNMRGQHIKYLPYAFTEQGVAMLATVLRSEKAVETSIRIMDAFVKMKHFIKDNSDIYKSLNRIDNKLIEHDDKLEVIFSKFDKKEKLLLKGETFDAYLDILEIMRSAKGNIIVIDNYADISFLDLIRNIKCNITLITKNSKRLSDIEITKYNIEYHNLKVIRNNDIHDRFIITDNKEIYMLGTSINSLGEKMTTIVKIKEKKVIDLLITNINELIDNNSKI